MVLVKQMKPPLPYFVAAVVDFSIDSVQRHSIVVAVVVAHELSPAEVEWPTYRRIQ
jgi:hypothetical protein